MGILSLILAGAGLVCLAMSVRGLAVLAFAAAVAVWLVPNLGGGGPPGFAVAAEVGPAPEARFRAVDGTSRTLADFRGRVVLLNAARLVKRKMPDPMETGGDGKPAADPVTIVRSAVAASMVIAIGIVAYLLSKYGCLA